MPYSAMYIFIYFFPITPMKQEISSMKYLNDHLVLNKNTMLSLRHATNWPANVAKHASLLLMPIDMFCSRRDI